MEPPFLFVLQSTPQVRVNMSAQFFFYLYPTLFHVSGHPDLIERQDDIDIMMRAAKNMAASLMVCVTLSMLDFI